MDGLSSRLLLRLGVGVAGYRESGLSSGDGDLMKNKTLGFFPRTKFIILTTSRKFEVGEDREKLVCKHKSVMHKLVKIQSRADENWCVDFPTTESSSTWLVPGRRLVVKSSRDGE